MDYVTHMLHICSVKNVNFKVIQEQLGHASIQETINTYSHLTMKDKEKATDYFNSIL